MMLFPSATSRQQRISELENEVLYLRHIIDAGNDPEVKQLAASLIALLIARLALLKKES